MGSLCGVPPEKKELIHELHQLANLGIRLIDSGSVGIDVNNPTVSSLHVEVKERQYEDPQLSHYRDTFHEKEKSPFELHIDEVLRYRGRFAKKKNDNNSKEMIQKGDDQAVTSKNNGSEEIEKVEEKNDTKQVEEKAVEIHTNKTKGEKQREKRKQRRRRNALKVVTKKGQEGSKNKEKKQRKDGEKENQNQVNNDNIDDETNQLLNKDIIPAEEVKNQEIDSNQEKNSLGQSNENTISEDLVLGESQMNEMPKKQMMPGTAKEPHIKSEAESSNNNNADMDNMQSK
ncbi:uncharacterized protein LOC132063460 [Lycium ferocissimum]|uniref:uncharacterized protein LOC132063460 n=1 Tax=Lycium ferocissimum TaxID=112874 RepID=UPI002815954F|nr:uncharacterized protein LOC132063460 [Lycium ferocissimum]